MSEEALSCGYLAALTDPEAAWHGLPETEREAIAWIINDRAMLGAAHSVCKQRIAELEAHSSDGPWYVGAMNDAYFVVDKRPSGADEGTRANVIFACGSSKETAEFIVSLKGRAETLESELATVTAERDKLQAFKDYVHQRLDDAGVDVDPDSPHKAAGCRIGGRLDEVFTDADNLVLRNESLRSELAALREQYRWVPVEDGPPETDDVHEVLFDGGALTVAVYCDDQWREIAWGFTPVEPLKNVSHYRLPPAPDAANLWQPGPDNPTPYVRITTSHDPETGEALTSFERVAQQNQHDDD